MIDQITKRMLDNRVKESFLTYKSSNELYVPSFHYYFGIKDKSIPSSIYITKNHITEFENVFYKKLRNYIPKDSKCYVAGGSVLTYLLYGNELLIRDYDIFVPNDEEFKKINNHLMTLKKNEIFENERTRHFSIKNMEIDLIKKPFETIDELFENFDIDLCKVGFMVENHKFTFYKKVRMEKIFERIFTINFAEKDFKKDGIMFLKRILKYTNKGFKFKHGSLLTFYSKSLLAYEENKSAEQFEKVKKELEEQIGKTYAFNENEDEILLITKTSTPAASTSTISTTPTTSTITSASSKPYIVCS